MKSNVQFCWYEIFWQYNKTRKFDSRESYKTLENIDDDRTYKRHRSQSPNIENDKKENDTEAINNEQNLDEKRVEEEFVKRYNLRERQEINYAEISCSDIDPYHVNHNGSNI
ncbi:7197_t:CDS:2 [Acaulospora colombiana]|uniref:7197_t:CDS:1 n=1 Tax=Acaulospora colombiana TaxID=27376 RepID=A0ACA9KLB6_9GLOM|nr:7197_t:CDS:2 [Acaulospora colombiana]